MDLAPAPLPGSPAVPAQQGVLASAPVVVPLVVGREEAVLEGVVVDEVLRLHHARGVDDAALGRVEVVVGEGLRQRIHAAVAADAVVQEDAAVAARAARYVLADAVRDAAGVQYLLHVAAQVVQHREAEHRAVGAGDEEGLGGGARRQYARRGRSGRPLATVWVAAVSRTFRSALWSPVPGSGRCSLGE